MTYRVSRTWSFSAAHSLPHLPEGHKCRRLHGHTYGVELLVGAERLDERSFVVDYAELDEGFGTWLRQMADHQNLNDIIAVTTAEGLARWFHEEASTRLAPALEGVRGRIEAVRVSEHPGTWAEYRP